MAAALGVGSTSLTSVLSLVLDGSDQRSSLSVPENVTAAGASQEAPFDFYVSTVIPLSVELVDFDAVIENHQVILTWSTASESNNAGFEVHHDEGGDIWQTIAFLAGAGTTDKPQTYKHVVSDVSPGFHRYRLRQIDADGTTWDSHAVLVRLELERGLYLAPPSPNPASEHASVTFAVGDDTEATLSLFNVIGQRIDTLYTGTPVPSQKRSLRIDGSRLASGTYFLRLTAGGRSVTRRLTIVR